MDDYRKKTNTMKANTKEQLKSEIQVLEKEINRLRADNDKMRQQLRDYRSAIISLIDHYTGEINRMMEPEVNNNDL